MKLAEYEQWRLALEEGGRAASADDQAHPPARARARPQGEGARRSGGAAHSKKNGGEPLWRTRTTTPTRRTRSDPLARSPRRSARRASGASVSESSASRLGPSSAGAIDPDGDDRRCGPHRRPRNALSPPRRHRSSAVLTSSRYAGLSPKQLVPQLADEGLYLASESTMYRVQRRYGLRTKTRIDAGRT